MKPKFVLQLWRNCNCGVSASAHTQCTYPSVCWVVQEPPLATFCTDDTRCWLETRQLHKLPTSEQSIWLIAMGSLQTRISGSLRDSPRRLLLHIWWVTSTTHGFRVLPTTLGRDSSWPDSSHTQFLLQKMTKQYMDKVLAGSQQKLFLQMQIRSCMTVLCTQLT